MKTTTRRFCATLVALASVIAIALPNKTEGQGVINSYMGLGPVNTTQSFVNDTAYALLNGLPSYGSWQSIADGSSVNVTNIFYSGSNGKAMYCALAVTSSVPFTLGSIYSTQTSPLFSFSGTLGADGFTYNLFGIGISSNGTVYTSGNANTLVNAVYLVGYNYAINIGSSTLQQASNTWAQLTPFNYSVSYTVNGLTASSTIQFTSPSSVPEPSTYGLVALGITALIVAYRRRN